MVARAEPFPGVWTSTSITAALAGSALIAAGMGVFVASQLHHGESVESPPFMSVVRRLSHSPSELYGRFGGWNSQVIIHAPLYYHLAGLCALPMARGRLDFVTAALAAGPLLTMSGLAPVLTAAYRLARLDRAPARTERLAISLTVTTPVVGGFRCGGFWQNLTRWCRIQRPQMRTSPLTETGDDDQHIATA